MTMQVTFNIDSSNLGPTVEDVFKSLTVEDRKQLAREVMLDVLTRPNGAERAAYEADVVADLIARHKNDSYRYDRITNEDEARRHSKFRERMSKFESSRERMMRMIVDDTKKQYEAMVNELVKNDPQTQALMAEVGETFVKAFPLLCQQAMNSFFVSKMAEIAISMNASFNQQTNLSMFSSQLRTTLQNHGIQLPF